jgi:hypothetical protein
VQGWCQTKGVYKAGWAGRLRDRSFPLAQLLHKIAQEIATKTERELL